MLETVADTDAAVMAPSSPQPADAPSSADAQAPAPAAVEAAREVMMRAPREPAPDTDPEARETPAAVAPAPPVPAAPVAPAVPATIPSADPPTPAPERTRDFGSLIERAAVAAAPQEPPPGLKPSPASPQRYEMPSDLVMVETSPEKHRSTTTQASPEGEMPAEHRRPARRSPQAVEAEPLVQVETRK